MVYMDIAFEKKQKSKNLNEIMFKVLPLDFGYIMSKESVVNCEINYGKNNMSYKQELQCSSDILQMYAIIYCPTTL